MNPLTQGAPAEVSGPGDTKSQGQGQTQRTRAPSDGGQAAPRKPEVLQGHGGLWSWAGRAMWKVLKTLSAEVGSLAR